MASVRGLISPAKGGSWSVGTRRDPVDESQIPGAGELVLGRSGVGGGV